MRTGLSSMVGAAALSLAPFAAAQQDEAPAEPRGLVANRVGAFQGYTLFAPLNSRTVFLVDMAGDVVHTWETSTTPTGALYFQDDGTLLRCGIAPDVERFHGGGVGGLIERLDWDGDVVWSYRLADGYQNQHHDIEPLPNGNLLLIAWEHRYREDAIEWGRDPEHVGEPGLWPDAVLELRPTPPEGGEVVWEWHAWDHLVQDLDRERTNWGQVADRPERIDINADHRDQPPLTEEQRRQQEELERQMRALGYAGGDEDEQDGPPRSRETNPDWLHTNAVAYDAEHDLIVLSTPHMNELWVIDHSTTTEEAAWTAGGRWGRGGDLLWRWGNPRNYGCGDDADKRLFYQHNPTWIRGERPGELRLLVFNNGGGRPGGDHSSVDELVLPFDPERGFQRDPGQAYGPREPVWSYSDPQTFFSPFISGAQRLPNGNTLICSGVQGRVLEVTRAGEVVWDYESPLGGDVPTPSNAGQAPKHALFRATRLARDHPGLAGRALTPAPMPPATAR